MCSERRVTFENEYKLPPAEVSDFAAAEWLPNLLLVEIQYVFHLGDEQPKNDLVMAFLIATGNFDRLRSLFAETQVTFSFSSLVLDALKNEETGHAFFEEFPELFGSDFLCALARTYDSLAKQLLSICTVYGYYTCLEDIDKITSSLRTDVQELDFLLRLILGETQNTPQAVKRIKTFAREFISCYENTENKSAQVAEFKVRIIAFPVSVLKIMFVECIQMGSVELLEAIYAELPNGLDDKFKTGGLTGNALIFVTNYF